MGLLGNAAVVFPELARRGERFDLVTDQTAAHDPLVGYVPAECRSRRLRGSVRLDPKRYLELSQASWNTSLPCSSSSGGLLRFRLWQQPSRGGL